MTDDEPEPFFMSTGAADPADPPPDASADDGGPVEDDAASEHEGPAADAHEPPAVDVDEPTEDLDALVAAARAAVEEAAGTEDAERTSDAMWGDDATGPSDPSAVWDDAATAAAENVWDLDDLDGTDVWGDVDAGAPDADDTTAATAPDAAAPATPPARPAAAEGMDHVADVEEEPETFAFPLQADAPPPRPSPPRDDVEPETFTFAAGEAAGAPTPTPGPSPDDAEDEPETFTFAVDAGAAPVDPAAAPLEPTQPAEAAEPAGPTEPPAGPTQRAEPAEEWASPVAATAAADGDEDDDDIWTFSMAHDDAAPLAEAARPRDDTGWRDLEAAQEPRWAVTDLPLRQSQPEDDEEEPPTFAMSIDDDASALGDLLDEAEATADGSATAAPTSGYEPGALADLDLDHLDDMVAAAEAAPAPAAEDAPDEDAPTADDAYGGHDGDEHASADGPLDAPTAARQVMEPGQVAFSSRKKRRGLFG